jgi:hypothetical protein
MMSELIDIVINFCLSVGKRSVVAVESRIVIGHIRRQDHETVTLPAMLRC